MLMTSSLDNMNINKRIKTVQPHVAEKFCSRLEDDTSVFTSPMGGREAFFEGVCLPGY